MPNGEGFRRHVPSIVTIVVLLAVWEAASRLFLARANLLPGPIEILGGIVRDRALYPPNVAATLSVAVRGFIFGNAIAVALALLAVVVPLFEGPIMQLAVVAYAVPILSVAPILVVLFPGDGARVILAALAVFFTTLIGTHTGLRQADRANLDVVAAYGGGRYAELAKVRFWSALPYLFAALRIAAPTALLGAIIAEFLGADRGLGIALIVSEQNLDSVRTLGIGVVSAVIAGLAYWAFGFVGRLLTPWSLGARGRP
jgi:ABC-type nitrate/sulfonate/bicarbonate transport system permease component